jgi:hypothetical protein
MNFDTGRLTGSKPKLGQRLILMLKRCSDPKLQARLAGIITLSEECQQEHDKNTDNLNLIEKGVENRINSLINIKIEQ